MARDPRKVRWEYFPCPAAIAAFEQAAETAPPGENRQERLDRLLTMGIWGINERRRREENPAPQPFRGNRAYNRAPFKAKVRAAVPEQVARPHVRPSVDTNADEK